MKVEISVSEMVEVFKEIQEHPGKILEMVRADMPKVVGEYLSDIMQVELTRFLGRKPYERMEELANHRNGSYTTIRFTNPVTQLKSLKKRPVFQVS